MQIYCCYFLLLLEKKSEVMLMGRNSLFHYFSSSLNEFCSLTSMWANPQECSSSSWAHLSQWWSLHWTELIAGEAIQGLFLALISSTLTFHSPLAIVFFNGVLAALVQALQGWECHSASSRLSRCPLVSWWYNETPFFSPAVSASH